MIKDIKLEDFTLFDEFTWEGLGNINLVIGENDTGKSNLLKLLYAVTRSMKEYSRALDDEYWGAYLAHKIKETFLPPGLEIGRLVRKGENRLNVKVDLLFDPGPEKVQFSFGHRTKKQIRHAESSVFDRSEENQLQREELTTASILFFPPKEVLTTRDAIIEIRERLPVHGFDATYVDLAKALRSPESQGGPVEPMDAILGDLENIFAGYITQNDEGKLIYRRGREKYGITQAAEGIKKVGALTQLIKSRHIQEGSILFFDEPGANLHPQAIMDVVNLLFRLGQAGVQIFIATHSYVVLKQFELLAREHQEHVPLCVLAPNEDNGVDATFADLQDRIPANSIVDASVELFERDLDLSFQSDAR
jgi:energy-coupling factor transporter ATP-binding protein EcfA2